MNMDYRFQEVYQTAILRAGVYEMLANGFLKEPTKAYLIEVNKMANWLCSLEGVKVDINFAYDSMAENQAIQEYYDRIFVPSSGKYVPPFESAVINRELQGTKIYYGALNTLETKHVLECYQSVNFNPWGLDIFKPVKGFSFADFIGFELAFMSFLCYAQADADGDKYEKWQNLQKKFIEQHLGRWCFDYAELVQRASLGLYSALANIIAEWVNYELKFVLQWTGGV